MSSERKTADINRREFLSQTGRGAVAAGGGLFAVGTATSGMALAQAQGEAAAQPASTPPAPGFLVGWASVSITPDKPVQLHGQFNERVSQKVLDPCMATALALERAGDGAEQAIMVSCDIVNIDRIVTEDVRKRVAERLPDFDARKLFLNATHTHTGPTMMKGLYKDPDPGVMGPEEYAEFFAEHVAQAAVQAWAARKPGAISRAVGHAAVGFCRIVKYNDGTEKMYGSTDDPRFVGFESGNDHGLELLFMWDEQQKLTGIVVNVACPSQVVEGQLYVSADFWGPVRAGLRKLYGENLSVYAMVSAAGCQSPRDLVRRGRNEPDMRSEPGMHEMGRRIVSGVQAAFETVQTAPQGSLVFKHHVEELELPARRVTDEEVQAARDEIKALTQNGEPDPASGEARRIARAKKTIERRETQGDAPAYSIDLHVIRLGDVAIATNPFELYLDYGLRMKARSRAGQTLLVQLACDRGMYLPARTAVGGGAYSSNIADNTCGPEGGDALVERTVAVINGMWEA